MNFSTTLINICLHEERADPKAATAPKALSADGLRFLPLVVTDAREVGTFVVRANG